MENSDWFIDLSHNICREIDHYLKFDAINNICENHNVDIREDLDKIIIKYVKNSNYLRGYIKKTDDKVFILDNENNTPHRTYLLGFTS